MERGMNELRYDIDMAPRRAYMRRNVAGDMELEVPHALVDPLAEQVDEDPQEFIYEVHKSGNKVKDFPFQASEGMDGRKAQPSGSGLDAPCHNIFYALLNDMIMKYGPIKTNGVKGKIEGIVSEGIQVDPQKIEAVKNWPRPLSASDIHSFLDLNSYYRRFRYLGSSTTVWLRSLHLLVNFLSEDSLLLEDSSFGLKSTSFYDVVKLASGHGMYWYA
ncbi:hypothetical protein MTR67_018272 [Solanum verrucosum]|uniref:Uncharacterized protein n=1 Tax=Solanum verrucosum TaxID=315347 RepID=A0AAF0QLF1_SOLVR|nr:hypothetical protein MTR67_018272 [Solanum verrucosum]